MVRHRRLIRALLVALALALAGCASTPTPAADARDPEIYRPVNPQYPMPER